jgi:hypothetical protein
MPFWTVLPIYRRIHPIIKVPIPDDREKGLNGSPRDEVFRCRNQEETMKVIQLPSIQQSSKHGSEVLKHGAVDK